MSGKNGIQSIHVDTILTDAAPTLMESIMSRALRCFGCEATLLFMMLGNLGIAFSDVVVDGFQTEFETLNDSARTETLQGWWWRKPETIPS